MHFLAGVSTRILSRALSRGAAQRPTAAMLVIGDEILNGKTHDSNSFHLARALWPLGVSLDEIRVIHDDSATIRTAVRAMSEAHTLVVTSGGIGCTHDDITYAALADEYYGGQRSLDGDTVERMRGFYHALERAPLPEMATGVPVTDAEVAAVDPRLRMALLPHGCATTTTEGLWVPTAVVAGNIHVLPGVPGLFARMADALAAGAATQLAAARPHRKIVVTRQSESEIAEELAALQREYGARVAFGSYPHRSPTVPEPTDAAQDTAQGLRARYSGYIVRISIEGIDKDLVNQAAARAAAAFDATIEG
jgi:molybdenum cofactor synthesis domain-containing protein